MGRVIHIACTSLRFVVEGYWDTQHSANPIYVSIKSKEGDLPIDYRFKSETSDLPEYVTLPTVCGVKLEAPDIPECIAENVLESLTKELATIIDMFLFESDADHCKETITVITNRFLDTLTSFGKSVFDLKNS